MNGVPGGKDTWFGPKTDIPPVHGKTMSSLVAQTVQPRVTVVTSNGEDHDVCRECFAQFSLGIRLYLLLLVFILQGGVPIVVRQAEIFGTWVKSAVG